MVQTQKNPDTGNTKLILTPNKSTSWRFNMMVWLSLFFISLVISTAFLLKGLWLILPFSGLELLTVYLGLYFVTRQTTRTEVITFSEDRVMIQKGHKRCEHTWEYQRHWSKILVKQPAYRGYPKQIFIQSHGKELELGNFLNKTDKEELINNLKQLVYT